MTSTEELGHRLTRIIADAVTDVLAHVASFTGDQVTAAVIPRPPTGEPEIDREQWLDCVVNCDAACEAGPQHCRWIHEPAHKPGWHTHTNDRPRIRELEHLAEQLLIQFDESGHPGRPCKRTGWIDVQQIDRWWAVYRGAADQPDDVT